MAQLSYSVDLLEALSSDGNKHNQTDVADLLDGLAVLLRQESLRQEASKMSLPISLVRILQWKDSSCVFQAGRVAANLAADCDVGRMALLEAGYIDAAFAAFQTHEVKSLVISLLNMTMSQHEQIIETLQSRIDLLILLASLHDDVHLWTIVHLTCHEGSQLQNSESVDHLEKGLNADEDIQTLVWEIAEQVAADSDKIAQLALRSGSDAAMHFIASSAVPYGESAFWRGLQVWLNGDEKALAVALIAFGNAVNDDTTEAIMDLMPRLLQHLSPSATDQVQHAVLGLVRNLSVRRSSRLRLVQMGIVDRILQMRVWAPDRDRLGSIQGAAIVAIKNLCVELEATMNFAESGQADLLRLISRTEEQPLKWEATRVLVNMIKTAHSEKIRINIDPKATAAIVDMLRTADKHVLLLNEAMITLILLHTQTPVGNALTPSDIAFLTTIASEQSGISPEVRKNAMSLRELLA